MKGTQPICISSIQIRFVFCFVQRSSPAYRYICFCCDAYSRMCTAYSIRNGIKQQRIKSKTLCMSYLILESALFALYGRRRQQHENKRVNRYMISKKVEICANCEYINYSEAIKLKRYRHVVALNRNASMQEYSSAQTSTLDGSIDNMCNLCDCSR